MLKPRSVLSLAATVALLTVVAPSQLFSKSTVLASTSTFEVPANVPAGTTVRVSSGSDAMNIISDALKTGFEDKFQGSNVNVDTVGTDQAIGAVLNGDADLAAVNRPLNDVEIGQGLASEDIKRIKIAVIVSDDNPFSGSLTSEQFAKIFRGEITNWSEVGGPNASIRLVDRPDISDTRVSLSAYPVFQAAKFATGATAAQLNVDSTPDVVKQLGTDGISYALFDEVDGMAGVRALPMHKTLPTDARYPFSQPFSFVYKGQPSPGSDAFLGYAAGTPGQTVLKAVNPFAGLVNAAGNTVTGAVDAASDAAGAAGNVVQDAAGATGNVVKGTANAASDAVKGAADTASDAIQGAAGAAGDTVKGVADAAGDVAGNAIQGAGDATDATGDAVQDTAGAAGNAIQDATEAVDQNVRDVNPRSQTRLNLWWLLFVPAACLGLVAWGERRRRDHEKHRGSRADTACTTNRPNVVKGIGRAGAAAGGATAAAGGAAWSATSKTGNVARDGLGNIGNAAKGGLGTVKGGLDNIGNAAQGGLNNAGDAAKSSLGAVKGGLDQAGNAVQSGMGAMGTGIRGSLDKAGDAAKGDLGAVKGGFDDGLNKAGDAAKGSLGAVKGGLNNAGDAVQDGVGGMGAGIKGGLNQAGNTLRDGTDAVRDRVSDMANQTGDVIQGGADTAKNAPKSLWDRVRDGVDHVADKTDDMANQAKRQAGNLKDGAENLGQQGMDKASDIADKLTNPDS